MNDVSDDKEESVEYLFSLGGAAREEDDNDGDYAETCQDLMKPQLQLAGFKADYDPPLPGR